MIELLWRRESEHEALDTPSASAALDAAAESRASSKIADPNVRNHYQAEFKDRAPNCFRESQPIAPPSQSARGNWVRERRGEKPRPGNAGANRHRETLTSELARKADRLARTQNMRGFAKGRSC